MRDGVVTHFNGIFAIKRIQKRVKFAIRERLGQGKMTPILPKIQPVALRTMARYQ